MFQNKVFVIILRQVFFVELAFFVELRAFVEQEFLLSSNILELFENGLADRLFFYILKGEILQYFEFVENALAGIATAKVVNFPCGCHFLFGSLRLNESQGFTSERGIFTSKTPVL